MGRKSSMRRLPPEVLAEINRLLSEGRYTLDEIVAHLRGLGVDTVSRSALGRQKQRIDKVAAKLRQSREIMDGLMQKLGPDSKDGERGRLLSELLRGLVFDYLGTQIEGGEDFDPKTFQALSRTARDLSHAVRLDQDFETKIREQVTKETVKAVEDTAREAGLSADTVEAIKRRVLGLGRA